MHCENNRLDAPVLGSYGGRQAQAPLAGWGTPGTMDGGGGSLDFACEKCAHASLTPDKIETDSQI